MSILDHDTLAEFDATALADLVRQREVSPLELVDAALERLERVNGRLNAVITSMADSARQTARAPIDPKALFPGVPFLMKDFLAEVAGERFTEGSAFLGDFMPDQDSELVRRFCAAGLITIGKTNTPEFAVGATTEPRRFGATHNPWDLNRTPGGSSGGSAAAVAARVVPMAHGNDAGGSIRIPASCCGLIGLKPGRARVPLGPLYGDLFTGIVSEFALTRSVRDTAALLEAVAGPMRGDPYFAPPPERPYTQETERAPGQLRIGFSITTPLGDPVDDACMAAVKEAADLCASLGHEVEEAAPSFDAESLWSAFTTLLCSGTAWAVRDWTRRLGRAPGQDDLEPFVAAFVRRGEALSASELLLAVQDVQRGVRDMLGFYRHHDVWLTPTLGQPPVPLGTLVYREGEDPFELRRRTARFSPFTYLSNASGQPAISLPLHWTDDGLPVGVLFTADHGGEGVLLRLAAHIEQARPWAARRPGVCAV